MSKTVEEKITVLVSGGSRGLGHGISKAMLENGYRVATFSRKESDEVRDLAKDYPDDFIFIEGDLGNSDDLKRIVKTTTSRLGRIGILINNAGMVHEELLVRQTEEQINRIIDVNLRGTLLLTRLAVRGMMVNRWGRVVNISSIVGSRGFTGVAPYSATKAGLDGMTRALARELGKRNITVNSVAPGYMETEMVKQLNPNQMKRLVRRTPLGRAGRVEDVTGAIMFFVSDAGGFATGQTLIVDGGITC